MRLSKNGRRRTSEQCLVRAARAAVYSMRINRLQSWPHLMRSLVHAAEAASYSCCIAAYDAGPISVVGLT